MRACHTNYVPIMCVLALVPLSNLIAADKGKQVSATVVSVDPKERTITIRDVSGDLNVMSEVVLKKGKDKWVGWRVSEGEFETCTHQKVLIENGTISKSDLPCPPGTKPPIRTTDTFPLDRFGKVSIDGALASLKDLKAGDVVSIRITARDGQFIAMDISAGNAGKEKRD